MCALFSCLIALLLVSVAPPATAQSMPADYAEVLQILGRPGDFKDGVLRVGLPRNDLRVTVAGVATPTPFGFGGWIALTKGDSGMDVLMGDLVLLEDEVNPVLTALLENGLDATALHNHFFWEQPRIFYMHVHGHGPAADLARRIRPALALFTKPALAPPPGSVPPELRLNAKQLSAIVGFPGDTSGAVYKITAGRPDPDVREMGALINSRMGLNTWAAFTGTMDDAVIAGDFAMLENEVTPVVKALRRHGLSVVAIHHHMTSARPVVIFLHYWGRGKAADLASAFRAALDVTTPVKPQ